MSTTGRREATETGPVNGIRSPLNLSIKLIFKSCPPHFFHAFLLLASSSAAPRQLPLHSKASLHRRGCCCCSQVGSEDYYSTPTPPWLSSYHSKVHHTSASLTINENYDSDVRDDTETFLNKFFPEGRSALGSIPSKIIIVLGDQLLPLNSGAK